MIAARGKDWMTPCKTLCDGAVDRRPDEGTLAASCLIRTRPEGTLGDVGLLAGGMERPDEWMRFSNKW